MFGGHNDEKSDKNQDEVTDTPAPVINADAAPATDPAVSDDTTSDQADQAEDETWQHPGKPLEVAPEVEKQSEKTKINDVISPAGGYPRTTSNQVSDGDSISDEPNGPASPALNDLIDVRQKALGELSPLLDQLDLSPEEKFRAVMMVIQASDDQALVKEAYEAAHAIQDDKTRAQALLDIINEINYFTTPQSTET